MICPHCGKETEAPASPANARAKVVSIALSQLGRTDPKLYWRDALPPGTPEHDYPKHWCGGFTLWCLKQAGLAPETFWKVGAGYLNARDITKTPEPGDIAYFQKFQHHAIVERVEGPTLYSVDGNPVVKRGQHNARDATFYSIRKWVG